MYAPCVKNEYDLFHSDHHQATREQLPQIPGTESSCPDQRDSADANGRHHRAARLLVHGPTEDSRGGRCPRETGQPHLAESQVGSPRLSGYVPHNPPSPEANTSDTCGTCRASLYPVAHSCLMPTINRRCLSTSFTPHQYQQLVLPGSPDPVLLRAGDHL